MDEITWYVAGRIARDRHGNVHWFVESSDGLSHGHLVDEGSPTTLTAAALAARRAIFGELVRLIGDSTVQLPFPDAPPHVGW
jgi:hypothetical protein